MSDVPYFLGGIASKPDDRPHLIAVKIGDYTTRRFRRGVKRLCKHFSIPSGIVTDLYCYQVRAVIRLASDATEEVRYVAHFCLSSTSARKMVLSAVSMAKYSITVA